MRKTAPRYCDLAGVSMEVTAACEGQQFREKMLITHRGLSGPAILQISSYWNSTRRVKIDLAPEREIVAELLMQKTARTAQALRSRLRELLPNRFADRWIELHPPSAWTNSALEDWEKQMHGWAIAPAGTEGFEKAEVTVGGVDTERALGENHGGSKGSGAVLHRGSGGCDGTSGGIQLSVGVGVGEGGGGGAVSSTPKTWSALRGTDSHVSQHRRDVGTRSTFSRGCGGTPLTKKIVGRMISHSSPQRKHWPEG